VCLTKLDKVYEPPLKDEIVAWKGFIPGFNVPVGGFAVVVVLRDAVVPSDRLRVSFDYVQE